MDSINVAIHGSKARTCFTSLQLASNWIVNPFSFTDQSSRHSLADAKTLIVFFDDSIDLAALCQTLAASPDFDRHPVRVCVFCAPPESIDEQLARLFNDFIFFPCTANEFKLRLDVLEKQLISQQAPYEADSVIHLSLLEEFASLNLRGNSDVFAQTLRLIKQTAKCDASVLIEGETGTGKENAARAIHYLGKRQDGAFVPVNCGALPDSLLESELFGYEKGAFTDAKQKQQGLVALANKGTLFLDEVDSLSPKAQAALLRFLQTGEYRPLGGGATWQSDVRVIAATNANLAERVRHREFREDLYFRLNVLNVCMPPLRERPSDIEAIADYLIKKYLDQYGNGPTRIHPATLLYLQGLRWPGNVRELENVLLREFLLSPGDQIIMRKGVTSSDQGGLYSAIVDDGGDSGPMSFQQAKEVAISRFECSYLQNLLTIADGNVTEAARLAGKERRCFGKLIKKYNIDKSKFSGHRVSI